MEWPTAFRLTRNAALIDRCARLSTLAVLREGLSVTVFAPASAHRIVARASVELFRCSLRFVDFDTVSAAAPRIASVQRTLELISGETAIGEAISAL